MKYLEVPLFYAACAVGLLAPPLIIWACCAISARASRREDAAEMKAREQAWDTAYTRHVELDPLKGKR